MRVKKDTYYYSVKIGFNNHDIDFDTAEKKLETDLHDSIRISNKRSQIAMYKTEAISEKFMKIASIERKKEKKRAFFAKHKKQK